MKQPQKIIGKMFGVDLVLLTEDDKLFEYAKKKLARVPEIWFMEYPDGHHPDFFEYYPQLNKYRKQNV